MGRSVGSFRPKIFAAALRAAGRSVGSNRVENTENPKTDTVGRRRRAHFQLRIPQVALVDAIASLEDPHSVEQLFASFIAYAGGWACWERSFRALLVELSTRVV